MNNNELNEKQKNKYKKIRIIIQILVLVLILAAVIWLTILIYPYMKQLQNDEAYRNEIISKINKYGSFSWIIIIGAQILQTILAVIPSGPIVMVAGVMFHPVIAVILCLIGQTLGALLVFFLVKWFGYKFIALFFDPDKIKNSKILKDESKAEVIMFGYLLIPALPKDIVSFVAPFTKTKWYRFSLINFFARIPMTIVTVLMAASIVGGKSWQIIVLGGISLTLAILCFIFNNKIANFLNRLKVKKPKSE